MAMHLLKKKKRELHILKSDSFIIAGKIVLHLHFTIAQLLGAAPEKETVELHFFLLANSGGQCGCTLRMMVLRTG